MISQIFHSNLKAIGVCKGCWEEAAIYSRREPEEEMSLKDDRSRRKDGKKIPTGTAEYGWKVKNR